MTGRWFKFMPSNAEEEFGFGTEEEAYEYAGIINSDCDGERCTPKPLSEAQAAGLVVLVTPNTFLLNESLATLRSCDRRAGQGPAGR